MSINNLDWIKENREYLIKQTEMLQNSISRMATHSLTIKQVGLTVWSAIVGFGFTNRNPALFILAFVSFALFGLLDIYYLYLERKFRDNFNRLARILGGYISEGDDEWMKKMRGNFVKPDPSTKFLGQFLNTLRSWANLPYLITFVITIALLITPLPPNP
ncbi:MAG: hypothetical protein KME15_23065 [Drouetiella hepatica Uher 2000/2452]|jgi:hypothetical protein|uniref:Uncharacterized protein n=1 Tax=Drouetiella hepatica Uher 2000/2452 TaxID=904376 RepID=A0A951QGS6_9CYAN|nr:hypothetical protein [Drouetiella hepatica Uher 2000/2452]